ncbi:hypothetical protein HanIR_Chr09g0427541 [Helianthus annuus]|nr:hypothetical protein HanIR_Chr09g0427541 [Helianthus annuus]
MAVASNARVLMVEEDMQPEVVEVEDMELVVVEAEGVVVVEGMQVLVVVVEENGKNNSKSISLNPPCSKMC